MGCRRSSSWKSCRKGEYPGTAASSGPGGLLGLGMGAIVTTAGSSTQSSASPIRFLGDDCICTRGYNYDLCECRHVGSRFGNNGGGMIS